MMGMRKGRKRIVVDRGVSAGDIEGNRLAGVERAVRVLSLDGLAYLGVIEGDGRIVPAVSGIARHRDVVQLQIIDFLRRAFADLQSDKLHAWDAFAAGRILEQGYEPR